MSRLSILIAALFLFGYHIFFPQPSVGCAKAPPLGAYVEIAEESAVIIWDAATKTQHFIRRAGFRSNSDNFGFLVPVPSLPELEEAKDSSFARLEEVMRPRIVEVPVHGIRPVSILFGMFLMNRSHDTVSAPPSVRVLISKTVSGYDAVVLEADDSASLIKWLDENGYDASDALLEWVEPYIQNKWKIAAFKISSDGADNFATSPVRMTFKTDTPFFPYREPQDPTDQLSKHSRMLRLFVISTARVEGTIGAGKILWPGKTKWSDLITAETAAGLSSELALKPEDLPKNSWLTVFEDESSPRPGVDDLFFNASISQEKVLPPPLRVESDQRTPVPLEIIPLFIGLVLFLIWRKKPARA